MRGLPGLLRRSFFRGLLLFGQPLLLFRLPLELGLPGRFRGGFLRGLLFFGEPRLFFRLGLCLFLGEAGGLRFLFRLLLCQPRLFFHIGLEQNCQLPADHRPRALPVGIRVIHVPARAVGQAGGIDRQQKRLRGPDDADVVLCAVVAAVFVGDGRLVHIDVRLEIRARAGDLQIVDELSVVLLPVPHDLQRVHHHPGAEEMVVVVILRDLLIRHGEIFPHGLLVFRPVADAPPEGVGQLVVGVDERLVMRLV